MRSPRAAVLHSWPASRLGVPCRHGGNGDGVRHLAAASTNGAAVNPVVSKAVATAAGGPFLVAAMGFAAFLMAVGLLTLRTGVFSRWTGIVALIGAVCFLVTFLTVIDGTTDGSAFGYAFFPAILSLVIWTFATSIARYRAVTT